jgi:hypothetical protein
MEDTQYNSIVDSLAVKLAYAIALAEGFFVEGSLPARTFNPGDMKLGDRGFGTEQEKTIYAKADPAASLDDRTDGWSALKRECTAILTGASTVYSVNNSFVEVSILWTGADNPGPWCLIVTTKLGVEPLDKLSDWVKAEYDRVSNPMSDQR